MNLILFLTTTLMWGSTWLAIQYQLGGVSPLWSIFYRFGLASILLIVYCVVVRLPLSFNRKLHGWIALQAFFMFFLNYNLFYFASSYFISGIIATIFAMMIVMNIINGRIFLKNPIELKTVIGAFIGIIGLCCIVWTEIVRLEDKDFWYIFKGVSLTLGATLSASFGQMIFVKNMNRGLPVIQINALGYGYGSLYTLFVAILLGQAPGFDWTIPYVSSLLYLVFFGTIVGFLSYLNLSNRIGPEKSAYAFVLIPVVAMGLSTFFEDLIWTPYTVLGMMLVLLGNIIVMTNKLSQWRLWKLPQESTLS